MKNEPYGPFSEISLFDKLRDIFYVSSSTDELTTTGLCVMLLFYYLCGIYTMWIYNSWKKEDKK